MSDSVIQQYINSGSSSLTRTDNITHILNLIKRVANNDTLIVFDVDEVLLHPKDAILSGDNSRWSYLDTYADKHNDVVIDYEKLEIVLSFCIERTNVDKNMQDVINYIANQNIKALALTHCEFGKMPAGGNVNYASIEEWREGDLLKIGIDFTKLSQLNTECYRELLLLGDGETALLYNGIIFTNGNDKGECLEAALKNINLHPSTIVFIDDHVRNLTSVREFCEDSSINFYGIHYTAAAQINTECNEAREKLQLETLVEEYRWLSDSEADGMLDLWECILLYQ